MTTCRWKQPWPVPGPSGSPVIRSAALRPGTQKLAAKTIMHWWLVILRIREDTGSNFCLKTSCPKYLHRFPQSLLINTGTVPPNDTTNVPSTQIWTLNSWSSCHSPVDSTWSSATDTVSLNKRTRSQWFGHTRMNWMVGVFDDGQKISMFVNVTYYCAGNFAPDALSTSNYS
jgi:hypothetical protein